MKRTIVIGVLGLAVAGCSQGRWSSPRGGPRGEPVGLVPVPSLEDTINRGTGPPEVQKATLADPQHPRWAGRIRPPGSAPPLRQHRPTHETPNSESQQAAGGLAVKPLADSNPTVEFSDPPRGDSPSDHRSLIPSVPSLETESLPLPQEHSPASAADELTPSPTEDSNLETPGKPEANASNPPQVGLPPVDEPEPQAPSDPITTAAGGAVPALPGQGVEESDDPLLGPNPQIMPQREVLAPTRGSQSPRPAGSTARSPAADPQETLPEFEDSTTPGATIGPLEPAPSPEQEPKANVSNGQPAAEDSPHSTSTGIAQSAEFLQQAGTEPEVLAPRTALIPSSRSDPAIRLTSHRAEDSTKLGEADWKEAGRAAARVGDEIITLHDLVFRVREQLKRNPQPQALSREELNEVAKQVLSGLIEQSLVVQELKRELKNPKQFDRLIEAADKYWREHELPSLLRRFMVENELQLRQKLEESGRPLASLHEAYRRDFMAQIYLHQKLAEQYKVELPEMLRYYNFHMHDSEFYRPARITWREIVVEKARHPNPEDARRKAESLLARLQDGEDLARLARLESEGPSRARAEGGLMSTSPGSYAVEVVNDALDTLPIGQLSTLLEGPSSYHIVRVENRRAAGPASFEEVQDQIRQRLMAEKAQSARREFLAKLRRNTIVTTIFDGTESDPNTASGE